MATIGVVNADSPDTVERMETQCVPMKLYFGVFFDGTGNNMVDKAVAAKFRASAIDKGKWEAEVRTEQDEAFRDGANQLQKSVKYSNVAILHSIYSAMSQEELKSAKQNEYVKVFNIYVEGAGTDAVYDGSLSGKAYNLKGSISGKGHSGVSQLVCKAVNMVRLILNGYSERERNLMEVHFDVYGFSRGATCARLFSFLAVRNYGDVLPCENEFKDSPASIHFSAGFLHFVDDLQLKSVAVDFLGLFDTVSSIGGISAKSYANNTTDYGLYSPNLPKVKSTFHLCAMDEYREHFALTDIGKIIDNPDSAEIFIPGCHSDVGGGYANEDNCNFSLVVGRIDNIHAPVGGKPFFIRKHCLVERFDRNGRQEDMGKDSFCSLGWIRDGQKYWETPSGADLIASVRRRVDCGYSNIPLEMMEVRSSKKARRTVFKEIPLTYKVNDGLFGEWKSEMLEKANTVSGGRDWYYPGNSLTSASYRKLRQYLHFSSNSSIGFTPCYDDKLLGRYLYHGDKGDPSRHYLHNAY